MTTPATLERRRLADELLTVGPGAPTLCGDWTARDLAAHIVLRDSRPDAAPGILLSPLSGWTDRVQGRIAEREWTELVQDVRNGPPFWSPFRIDVLDRLANTAEFHVHLEDVRRGGPDWEPRTDLDADLVDALDGVLRRGARLMARSAPTGLELRPDDREPVVAKQADRTVTVRGPVSELVLWLYGRQAHSRVRYEGPADAIEAVRTASFGI